MELILCILGLCTFALGIIIYQFPAYLAVASLVGIIYPLMFYYQQQDKEIRYLSDIIKERDDEICMLYQQIRSLEHEICGPKSNSPSPQLTKIDRLEKALTCRSNESVPKVDSLVSKIRV
jgi:hypothetical protein